MKKSVVTFLALTAFFTLLCDFFLYRTHNWGIVFLRMWVPAFAAFAVRILFDEGFSDVGFALGKGVKNYLVAWLYPVLIGSVAYVSAWALSLESFVCPKESLPFVQQFIAFLSRLFLMLTLGTAYSLLSATGEELGWRGYFLPKLTAYGTGIFEKWGIGASLLVGIVWGLWHMPLIFLGLYTPGKFLWLSVLLFFLMILLVNELFSQLRIQSGSVWPAASLHASWNAVIQGAFDRYTKSQDHALWTGESGILTCIVVALFFFYFRKQTPKSLTSQVN